MSKLAKALTAAAGNAGESLYVEDVFSTYLYEGFGSTQTITNGIDLSGEGGLVWLKNRDGATNHRLYTTDLYSASNSNLLQTNLTSGGSNTGAFELQSFNSNGFTLGYSGGAYSESNAANTDYASWTFRKAEKFFDVRTVTHTNGTDTVVDFSNLGTIGAVISKNVDAVGSWWVSHRYDNTKYLVLNNTDGEATAVGNFGISGTNYTIQSGLSSGDYVIYAFAHDAGGFGDDGSESIIKCGSYVGTGASGNTVDFGFEPQWVLIKNTQVGTKSWHISDMMRGLNYSTDHTLSPNTSSAEANWAVVKPTATGLLFTDGDDNFNSAHTFIYIAIRRPMKTPESGTEVFKPNYVDNGASAPDSISNFPVDMYFRRYVNTTNDTYLLSRLTGTGAMKTNATDAEVSFSTASAGFDHNNGVMNIFSTDNTDFHTWMFKRATGFFDVVCYTGGGSSTYKYKHNLGVAPELIIIKSRSNGTNVNYWPVKMRSVLGQKPLALNSAAANPLSSTSYWSSFTDTATEFATRASSSAYDVNATGYTYVAYLFATVAGVSKVGSYTGTGSNVDVDCGFSAGARFILIKRTDSTGDWYVWDSVRGIVAGNDPYLLLNTTAAEVTSTDYIDPLASGFTVTSSAPAALNASGGSFVYLAIA